MRNLLWILSLLAAWICLSPSVAMAHNHDEGADATEQADGEASDCCKQKNDCSSCDGDSCDMKCDKKKKKAEKKRKKECKKSCGDSCDMTSCEKPCCKMG